MAEMPIPVGTTKTFNPTGSAQTIKLPPAIYTIEAYGAQGGSRSSNRGGYGGHSIGSILLKEETTLYIHVGQTVSTSRNYSDYGGGYQGTGGLFSEKHVGGGGSSDVRLRADKVLARLIVAGGGGGAGALTDSGHAAIGGNGGGLIGEDGHGDIYYSGHYYFAAGGGGSQTAGGDGVDATAILRGIISEEGDTYALGYGGKAYSGSDDLKTYAGSGGGGWHGGGGGIGDARLDGTAGGGGSGYLYTADYESYYPSGCLLHRDTDFLFNYENTGLVNEQSLHSGNGIIYITCQALPPSNVPFYVKLDGVWRDAEKVFTKIDNSWREADTALAKVDNSWN